MSLFKKNETVERPEKPTPKWVSVFGIVVLIAAMIFLFVKSQSYWLYSFNPIDIQTYLDNDQNGHFIKDSTTICDGSYFVMKHTINGIPVCTEYYYLCGDETTGSVFVVRADKNFYNNFDAATGVNASGVPIKGSLVSPQYDLQRQMKETNASIISGDYGLHFISGKYIDLMSFRVALGCLIGFILLGGSIISFVVFGKQKTDNKLIPSATLIAFVCSLFILLHYINYLF